MLRKNNKPLLMRILACVFALAMALPVFARDFTYTYEGQTLTYTVLDESAKTCETKEGYVLNWKAYPGNNVEGDLKIPAVAKDGNIEYSVTSIGSRAFERCIGLTSIEIPNSVTSIGDWAFENCWSLASIEIPNSVTSIGKEAFYSCGSLTSVTIPNSVTSIGEGTFQYCGSLNSIDIPNSVTSIGISAFSNCSSLTSVTIPNSVTSIGKAAFSNCSSLTSVTIPNSVTSIGEKAFYDCGLRSVIIGNSVTSIGDYAFSYCGLTSVTIPNSVTSIGIAAFSHCSSLRSVIFGNSVTSIGDYAFQYCGSLNSVTIPNSVTSIGNYAFQYCGSLRSVIFGNSVTSIGNYAFSYCDLKKTAYPSTNNIPLLYNIMRIPYPANEAIIENGVVWSADKSVIYYVSTEAEGNFEIPNSVTTIGDDAFTLCDRIHSISVGAGVQTIGKNKINPIKVIWLCNTSPEGYQNLKGKMNFVSNNNYSFDNMVVYPLLSSKFQTDGIVYVPVNPAQRTCDIIDCLYSDEVNNLAVGCKTSYSGIEMNIAKINQYAFFNNDYIHNLEITFAGSIPEYAFYDCDNINKISIPNTVSTIEPYAFGDCNSVKEINLKNTGLIGASAFQNSCTQEAAILVVETSVLSIGDKSFMGCKALTDIQLNNTGSIGASAFEGCAQSSPTKLSVGESVTDISSKAFYNCRGLTDIKLSNKGSIGANAFQNSCTQEPATLVVAPSVLNIKDEAFKECAYLTDIQISNTGSIGASAFEGCAQSSPAKLSLGESVTEISSKAFYGCSGLTDIKLNNSGSIGASAFQNSCTQEPATLVVEPSVLSIGDESFMDCTALTDIQLSNNGSIGASAFEGCAQLTDIKLRNTGSIGASAFEGCAQSSPAKLSVGESVTKILSKAFYNCCGLTDIKLSNKGLIGANAFQNSCTQDPATLIVEPSVLSIGDKSFMGCTALSDIQLNNTGSIGTSAFEGCAQSSPAKLSLGESVTEISSKAFYNCCGLTDVKLSNKGLIGASAFQNSCTQEAATLVVEPSVLSIGDKSFMGCKALTDIQLNNTGTIGASAFEGCAIKYPASLSLAESITSLLNNAFKGCSALQTAEINNSGSIGDNAFSGCSALEEINIGCAGMVGDYAFSGCSSALSLTIAPTVSSIGNYSFKDCSSIGDVVIKEVTQVETIEADNESVRKEYSTLILGSNGNNPIFNNCPLDEVFIGRKLSYKSDSGNGYSPFYRNTSLRSVEISDVETQIYDNEFYGCSNLQSVKIGDGVKSFGKYSFSGCFQIDSFEFGRSVQKIGEEAFSDCTAMTRLTSRNPLPPVCEDQALDDINKWTCTLHIPSDALDSYKVAEQWRNFFFMYDDVNFNKYFEYRGLYYRVVDFDTQKCEVVAHTDVPADIVEDVTGIDTVETVEIPSNVFYKGVVYNVIGIGNGAFSAYTDLKEIIIPETVEYLMQEAFANCPLTAVDVRALVPPATIENSFNDVVYAIAELIVPSDSKQAYRNADVWKNFVNTGVILGDSNDNGVVNIADAVNIANYVVGNEVDYFNFEASDINADERITVSDASATVTIILNQPVAIIRRAPYLRSGNISADRLVIDNIIRNGNRYEIPVTLENSKEYVAIQGDITLPCGMTLESISNGNRSACHSLMTKSVGDNILRFALFDFNNNPFADSDDEILRLVVSIDNSCTGNLSITNSIAADTRAEEYILSSCEKEASAIVRSNISNSDVDITADEEGIKVSNVAGREVAVFTTDALQVTRFIASDKEEHINVASGIYVVIIGNEVNKVIVK